MYFAFVPLFLYDRPASLECTNRFSKIFEDFRSDKPWNRNGHFRTDFGGADENNNKTGAKITCLPCRYPRESRAAGKFSPDFEILTFTCARQSHFVLENLISNHRKNRQKWQTQSNLPKPQQLLVRGVIHRKFFCGSVKRVRFTGPENGQFIDFLRSVGWVRENAHAIARTRFPGRGKMSTSENKHSTTF